MCDEVFINVDCWRWVMRYSTMSNNFLRKKRCYNVYWPHCAWCSVLSPSPLTSSWGYHFSEVEEINWGMIENCIFSVLLNLCTLLGLIKVCEPEVWAGGVIHYMFARPHMGAKYDQSMLWAPCCVFYKEFGFIPSCVFRVSRSRLLSWKYLCQKQGHCHYIDNRVSVFFWCPATHRMQCCLVFWFSKVLSSHPNWNTVI